MPTLKENLESRLETIGEILATGTLPSGQTLDKATVTVDGESMDVVSYKRSLYEEMSHIQGLLSNPITNGGVPWEHRHLAR